MQNAHVFSLKKWKGSNFLSKTFMLVTPKEGVVKKNRLNRKKTKERSVKEKEKEEKIMKIKKKAKEKESFCSIKSYFYYEKKKTRSISNSLLI